MRKILACLLILCSLATKAQLYNNEWIDHAKTYYKFKVSRTGLYRIPQSTLATAGLTAPAEHYQLWRNGVEVPIYTSKAAGTLGSGDYIEFWGRHNDGVADKSLYRQPDFQLNDKWSLETDTSVYFLTVNSAGNNKRLSEVANNTAGNSLPAEPFFTHTIGNYFKDKINPGYAVNVGEYLYSSSYDKGEGYTSGDLGNGTWLTTTFTNLFIYPQGPAPVFRINISGNAINTRQYRAEINDQTIVESDVDYFNYVRDSAVFPLAHLSTNSATVKVSNRGTTPNDRMVIHQYEFSYPREFNFGGASNFEFHLPARAAGAYLEISGFSFGSIAPVLYDLTAGKRYVGELSGSLVKIVVEPATAEHNYVLVSQEGSNHTAVTSLRSRTFTNYSLPANAGNYLIISNPALFAGANGTNPVEEYRGYRSSAAGGSFAAKVYLTEDLADQFSFGIKGHPESIRNFLRYARAKFPSLPKNILLIGKAVNYIHARGSAASPEMDKLNFVPTFGWPASDMLLTAEPGDGHPLTPIGRLSVINAEEIFGYLRKVKEYELAQKTASPYIKDKAWMKNVVHIVGASEPGLQLILDNYMNDYKNIIKDTLFGAKVTTFTKSSPEAVEQVNSGAMDRLFEEGISLITYFGHSSATTLDFNLSNPDQYNNQGKYPMFIGLGCNAGNFYNFNPARLFTKETLSERYVLAPDRGTIGFIASSHFGIVHYLDISNSRQYKSIAYEDYGKSMGEIMVKTIRSTYDFTTQDDFYARAQSEETSLHGDPAIILNTHAKPDYVIEPQLVKIAPAFISVADNSFKLHATFLNQGKAVSKEIVIEVKQEYPGGSSRVVYRDTIPGTRYTDSLVIDIPIVASRDKGANKLTVTIDADNTTEELFETNNSVTKEVFIYEDEARPVFPYNFAIVNQQNIKLKASTANPFSPVQQYRMELDTTELFSAPLATQTVSASGGVIEFDPGVSFADSTVYYWRIAPLP
ncbi:MAG TPA: C25 family cysteine peptidase, partial [Flavisolibacter sp.]|nr:C25 family cysteine peptidase [Flavisolibacter sp.]